MDQYILTAEDEYKQQQHLYLNINFISFDNMKYKIIYKSNGTDSNCIRMFEMIEHQKQIVDKMIDFLNI